MSVVNPVCAALVAQCLQRMDAQHMPAKGAKRDKAALEFIIGSAAALELSQHPEAKAMLWLATMVSCRGASFLTEYTSKRAAGEAL